MPRKPRPAPRAHDLWKPPENDTLPDLTGLEAFLEYGDEVVKTVPVRLIVGVGFGGAEWNRDWTLNARGPNMDRQRLIYHERKLKFLLRGSREQGWSPITQEWLLSERGQRLMELYELEGIYFVKGGFHRVAVAHQIGFEWVRGFVVRARFKRGCPAGARAWVRSLREAAESRQPDRVAPTARNQAARRG